MADTAIGGSHSEEFIRKTRSSAAPFDAPHFLRDGRLSMRSDVAELVLQADRRNLSRLLSGERMSGPTGASSQMRTVEPQGERESLLAALRRLVGAAVVPEAESCLQVGDVPTDVPRLARYVRRRHRA